MRLREAPAPREVREGLRTWARVKFREAPAPKIAFAAAAALLLAWAGGALESGGAEAAEGAAAPGVAAMRAPEGFVLVKGAPFRMGSPESEAWRGPDEAERQVSVSAFYLGAREVTQAEYEEAAGNNPSAFRGGDLPVENVSWIDAARYCNARSLREGLEPAYVIEGGGVSWNRAALGYRLPAEAEWEYACRAGTAGPFSTGSSIGADEANYYGHYPYLIEENYFSQGNLEKKPGLYRQKTVTPGSFAANAFGLYDMHGNVGEWVWDRYGPYDAKDARDPAGPPDGPLRVYRGGGWNDFAKNVRSAYRAALPPDKALASVGFRLALSAAPLAASAGAGAQRAGSGTAGAAGPGEAAGGGAGRAAEAGGTKMLIAFFSWGGTTRGIAERIRLATGADVFEIVPVRPYSQDYGTVLREAQRDQKAQARPEIAGGAGDIARYDVILLGYPNWWASIPMPVATFLEGHDLSGKTVIPFCSHGGGRLGQSLTAIAKLAPAARMGEPLSVHYSGGPSLDRDIAGWLAKNGVAGK